jgi:hypothetical protein
MTDLTMQFQNALAKAAEYDLLGCLTVDNTKREECRVKAQFYHDIASELRREMANLPKQGRSGTADSDATRTIGTRLGGAQ